jgi:hypothetical protein
MQQTVTPNLYHLTGHQLHITYATSGIDGKPSLTYQDTHAARAFRGDEIRSVECDLGTLVSVTLQMTPDLGSTTLSVLIPRMRVSQGTSATVHTDCVTALHRTAFAPQLLHGQLDSYTVTSCHGTAQAVVF